MNKKVKDDITEEIKTKAKNTLGETTMFFLFENLDERQPQTRGKTPTQSESEQSYKFRKTFRVLKMSRLQTKASGFKATKESLNRQRLAQSAIALLG